MNALLPVLTVEHISKSFGQKIILSDISFSLQQKEIVGLIGANGAGKTTLLYILLGLISPDAGNVLIFSTYDTSKRSNFLRYVNFASASHKLNGYASAMENLLTFARLYDVQQPQKKIQELSQIFDIEHLLSSKIKIYSLSAGEIIKVNLCKAFLNSPKLLLLDEISSHLDVTSRKHILAYLKQYCKKNNASILYITHNLKEASSFCDRNMIMKSGKVVKILGRTSSKKLESFL